MSGSKTYRPLAALHGEVKRESQPHHDRFWCLLAGYGAHADNEIVRLWSRVKNEETRLEHEADALWRRIEEFGAHEDAEIASLWRRIRQ